MGYLKRKATKAARKQNTDFESLKADFLTRVATTVQNGHIPPELILNWDQTGIKLVPIFRLDYGE